MLVFNKFQEQLMTWAGRASEDDRMQFLKRFLDALPETELTQVSNLVSKAKKRRKRFTARPVSVPVVSVSAPEDSSPDLEESTTALCVSATEVHMEETVSAPDSSVSVPVNSKDLRWCDKYQDNQVVAMDIEKVEHRIKKQPGDNSKKQFVMKAAIVSVANNLGEEIYRANIKHKPDDIRINQHAFKINGIRKSDLVAGKNLKDVQTELQAILQGKLVIMHGAEQDFNSLELPMGDFDYFDTQLFWFNCYITSNGKVSTIIVAIRPTRTYLSLIFCFFIL